MVIWRCVLTALFLSVTTPALAEDRPKGKEAASPPKSPELQLSDGRAAYQRGDYPLAVRTLTPLLYPSIELTTEDAVVEAHRLLVLSYLLQKQEPEAEEEATSILALRPAYQLDPIVDPPVAVAFFEGVRKKQDERLREVRERQQKEAEARAKEDEKRRLANRERVYVEKTVQKHSRLIATVPFGVGQFQNGQYTKAALFLSGELVLGSLSLASYIAIQQKFPYDTTRNAQIYPNNEHNLATGLRATELASGAAFWGLLIAGIIDAHVLYKPVVTQTREVPAPKRASLDFAPLIGSNSAGVSVGGRF